MKQFSKKIFGKISYWKRTIVLFVWKPGYEISQLHFSSEFSFSEIQTIVNFPTGFLNEQLENEYRERFTKNQSCCVLMNKEQIVSYGWVTTQKRHLIGELNIWIDVKEDTELLYDFATNENYRGQGLYPFLLQKICSRNAKNKIIYTLSNNTSSKRGILKANFEMLGVVKGINKNKIQRLLTKI